MLIFESIGVGSSIDSEVPKKTFQDAKDAAFQYLDACPIEVIQRFINQALQWMSAYRLGLTGKAAEWGYEGSEKAEDSSVSVE